MAMKRRTGVVPAHLTPSVNIDAPLCGRPTPVLLCQQISLFLYPRNRHDAAKLHMRRLWRRSMMEAA